MIFVVSVTLDFFFSFLRKLIIRVNAFFISYFNFEITAQPEFTSIMQFPCESDKQISS